MILAGSDPAGIQDEQTPAPVIPADLRAGEMDRAICFPVSRLRYRRKGHASGCS